MGFNLYPIFLKPQEHEGFRTTRDIPEIGDMVWSYDDDALCIVLNVVDTSYELLLINSKKTIWRFHNRVMKAESL